MGLVPNYIVSIVGKKGGGPHHMQGRHIRGLGIGLGKLVIMTLNIQLRPKIHFLP
jgi:hypothetical protein